MKEIIVFCEGPTEQGFCGQVLQPYLFPDGNGIVHTLAVGKKDFHHVYGIAKYSALKKFIQNMLKNRKHKDISFTTLIDLYGLPDEFPGKAGNTRNPDNPTPYVEALEEKFGKNIGDVRFVPHLQLHEYETLLFADPEAFRVSFENCEQQISELQGIVTEFRDIEKINDGAATAPSKRIIDILPAYKELKSSAGPDIAEFIGMNTLRAKCPHFDKWVGKLEDLCR